MARKIDRIATTLGKILRTRGLEGRLSEYRIIGQWERAVGATIALHALPHRVRGKKLHVVVDSPAWMQQLSLLKPEIIGKLNRLIGRNAISEISLKLGEVVSSAGAPPPVMPSASPLTQDERDRIEQYVHAVGDADIRDRLRRLIEKDFLRRKTTGWEDGHDGENRE